MNWLYRKPKTNKPKTPPKDNRLMQLAQKENFALFVLRGILSSLYHVKKLQTVDKHWTQAIDYAVRMCIQSIKREQAARMKLKGRKPK